MLGDSDLDALVGVDVPYGDLTTDALGIAARSGRICFTARGPMVACCTEESARMLVRAGATARCRTPSGQDVPSGTVLVEGEGAAGALHRVWKTAQTLIEYGSGIATATRRVVAAARSSAPDIAVECTRKSVPGTRALATRAVQAGGGQMHRLGLSETVLIFVQHTVFLHAPADLDAIVRGLRRAHPGKRIAIEAGTLKDALRFVDAGADIVQVDKFSPDDVATVARHAGRANGAPAVVAAGGIDADNAASYAATGCAALVTSWPYWARPADVHVTMAAR